MKTYCVQTLMQFHQGLVRTYKTTFDDGGRRLQLTLRQPLRKTFFRLFSPLLIIKHNKSIHPDPHSDNRQAALQPLWFISIILAGSSTHDESCVLFLLSAAPDAVLRHQHYRRKRQ